MTAQLVPSADAARLAYASAIQFEQDCAIGALEEQGANMLLDPDFADLIIPHLDGTYSTPLVDGMALRVALTKALKARLSGRLVVLGVFLTDHGFKEVRVDFRNGASQNLSSDEKEFLWKALTNLTVGAGNRNFRVSVHAGSHRWEVTPFSRQWMTQAFGG